MVIGGWSISNYFLSIFNIGGSFSTLRNLFLVSINFLWIYEGLARVYDKNYKFNRLEWKLWTLATKNKIFRSSGIVS